MGKYLEPLDLELGDYPGAGEKVKAEMGRGKIALTLSSDWAGDTETGFGQSVHHNLDLHALKELKTWIDKAIVLLSQPKEDQEEEETDYYGN